MRIFSLILAVIATPAVSHEFWIEPLEYQIEADGRLQGQLVNGQYFEGPTFGYLPQRFAIFAQFAGDASGPVEGRLGSRPALDAAPLGEGLNIVAYQSTVNRVTYETYDKFETFTTNKGFGDVAARHTARGLPTTDFSEAYTRFSKTLIGVGNAAGSDRRTGLETEIVALTNPYTDDLSDGVRVQVFYGTLPRADTQVELFAKAPDGTVEITLHRTDALGIATLPVTSGTSYLVDAVVLREPSARLARAGNVVWETLWASLTFQAP